MNNYRRFAHVYDNMGEDRFSERMVEYTRRILARLHYNPRSILDLACGTGTAAVLWAEDRIDTWGVDRSSDMLEMARKKAREHKVKIEFSRQDMTAFTMPRQFDLVTCYFDSLNYLLTLDDLTACFQAVNKILYPGAYFIFDVNTPEAMKILWDSQVYADENEDMAWIWKNYYFPKAKQAEVKATFFVRQGDLWEKFEEIHAERGYTVTEIRKVLRSAGLKEIKIYDCLKFKKFTRKSMRLAVVAQKPY